MRRWLGEPAVWALLVAFCVLDLMLAWLVLRAAGLAVWRLL